MNNKRVTDMAEFDEIGELIKQEDDHKTRAILVVLQNINLSLIANTNAVNDTDEQLKNHLIEFKIRTAEADALVNKGKGVWMILSCVLIIAQAMIVWAMLRSLDEINVMHSIDENHAARISILENKK